MENVVLVEGLTTANLGITPPRKRSRMLTLPQNDLSFFDFLRLDNCDIKRLVAKRNNQLGKHMQAANGMLYEMQIRQALLVCIPQETSPRLQAQLQKALVYKLQSRGIDFWRHSFGTDWFGKYANTSTLPLAWDDSQTLLASLQAWQTLNTMVLPVIQDKNQDKKQYKPLSENSAQLQKEALNDAIKTLETSQGLGRLQVSLVMSINALAKANRILANASPQTLCTRRADGSMIANKQIDYLTNVVTNYFAKDIQVYLARLNREGQLLVSEQRLLFDALSRQILETNSQETKTTQALNAFQQYQVNLEKLLTRFQQQTREHVREVQRVQQLCSA